MTKYELNPFDPHKEQREALAERFANMVTRASYETVPTGQGSRKLPAASRGNANKLVHLGFEQGFIDGMAFAQQIYAKEIEAGELEIDRQAHEKELQEMREKSSITIGADWGKNAQEVQFHGSVNDAENHPNLQDIREEEPESGEVHISAFTGCKPNEAPDESEPIDQDYEIVEGKLQDYDMEQAADAVVLIDADRSRLGHLWYWLGTNGYTADLSEAAIYTPKRADTLAQDDMDKRTIPISLLELITAGEDARKLAANCQGG